MPKNLYFIGRKPIRAKIGKLNMESTPKRCRLERDHHTLSLTEPTRCSHSVSPIRVIPVRIGSHECYSYLVLQ